MNPRTAARHKSILKHAKGMRVVRPGDDPRCDVQPWSSLLKDGFTSDGTVPPWKRR